MQQWEYCVVGPVKSLGSEGLKGYYPTLAFLTREGPRNTSLSGGNEALKIAQTIAQLGEEGWELTSCGSILAVGGGGAPNHLPYFKRKKQQ
jgi:hypothetical protein